MLAADHRGFGRLEHIFLAVGKVRRFAERIIRNDVHDQIDVAVVDELVRFTRLKKERIARDDRFRTGIVPHASAPGDDVIKLPLQAVRMERIRHFPGWNAQYFDVERVTFEQIGRLGFPSERLGYLFACTGKFAARR